tara:strand:+ start:190 stop:624 length:435 start_codon:yes stop_codon:yes gene_type:complete
MEYFSDASYDSDFDEEDEEIVPLYTEREIDYMELEFLLECRDPPPVIEYVKDVGVVSLRGLVLDLDKWEIGKIVDPMTVHSWNNFWKNEPINERALFSAEDWSAILEFSLQLLEACGFDNPTQLHVKNVMMGLLRDGNFKHPKM